MQIASDVHHVQQYFWGVALADDGLKHLNVIVKLCLDNTDNGCGFLKDNLVTLSFMTANDLMTEYMIA